MERSSSGQIFLVDAFEDQEEEEEEEATSNQDEGQSDQTDIVAENDENHNNRNSACGHCKPDDDNYHDLSLFFMQTPNNDLVLRIFNEVDQQYTPVYVHRNTLMLASSYFKSILNSDSSQAEMVIELSGYRFSVYMIYLKYIYTNYIDCSKEYLFEVYQFVSDLTPEDEEIVKLLRDNRDSFSAKELSEQYMIYMEHGFELYEKYNHEKMREFFEDFIWFLVKLENCDYLLDMVRETPLADRIAAFKQHCEMATFIPYWTHDETYSTHELRNWPIFYNFPQTLLYSLDKFYVFNSGKSVLAITEDDRVFGFGDNEAGELGVGHQYHVSVPEEVVELSGKLVVSFTSDFSYVMALTITGDLYAFGLNNRAQLGVNNVDDQLRPVLVMSRIKMVSCAGDHTLALDYDQNAWNWGSDENNKLIYNTNAEHEDLFKPVMPFKFSFCNNKKILHVACGSSNSMAVTTDHQLFVWGQFGEFPNLVRYRIPHMIYDRVGFEAKSVVSFNDNFLVLSPEGLVYFVRHYHGFVFEPLVSIVEPVEEMFVSSQKAPNAFAILLGQSGMLYELKHTGYPDCHEVKPIWPRSLADAFCKNHCNITPVLTKFSPHTLHPSRNQLVESFNQKENSDFLIMVNCEFIYLHRAVLRQRSTHLANLLDTEWKDRRQIVIQDPRYSATVYLHYFRYLYFGSWKLEQQEMKTVIGLYHLAQLYHDYRLKTRCEHFITVTLATTPPYKLKSFIWFKQYFEEVKQHFTILITTYSQYLSMEKCLRLFERVPALRETLLLFLSSRKSQIDTEPFYESMEKNAKAELQAMIHSDQFQLENVLD